MISVIIPLYNQANKITACLKSLLNQTFRYYEVIIVNDGSTDNPEKILNHYQEIFLSQRIYFKIINQANAGAAAARNQGARQAAGDYFLFLDADILMKKDMLEKMHQCLTEYYSIDFVFSQFYYGWKKFSVGDFDLDRLRREPYIHTTSLIRRQAFCGFDESLKRFQDWDLFLTIAEKGGHGKFIKEPLFRIMAGGHISRWLPSFIYRFFPNNSAVKNYQMAKEIILKKHGL